MNFLNPQPPRLTLDDGRRYGWRTVFADRETGHALVIIRAYLGRPRRWHFEDQVTGKTIKLTSPEAKQRLRLATAEEAEPAFEKARQWRDTWQRFEEHMRTHDPEPVKPELRLV